MHLTSYILLTLAAVAQGPVEKKTDEDKLQGDWTMVSKDPGLTGGRTFRFAKDRYEVIKSDGQIEAQGTFKLDAKKTPKQIDLVAEKENRTITVLGIYELDGDKLKMTGNRGKGERPTSFAQIEGDTRPTVTLLERKKVDKK